MNIAEIRKKKKKAEKKEKIKEILQEQEHKQEVNTTLPVPQSTQESLPEEYNENIVEDINFVDEESFYTNINKVTEDKEKLEFLCFLLGDEEYAISISLAKEVIKYQTITEVPNTTDIILGIVAIRGDMTPVFDIKKILGIQETICDVKGKKLILLKVNNESVCILVDRIMAIRKISPDQIEPTPMNLTITKHEFISGVVLLDDKMVRILNIENILSY